MVHGFSQQSRRSDGQIGFLDLRLRNSLFRRYRSCAHIIAAVSSW